jgi:SAM-dependent methyltransferase
MIKLPGERVVDDEIYLGEDRRNNHKDYFKKSVDILRRNSYQKDAVLLDIGCATGEYINFIKDKIDNFQYIGLDASQRMVDEAKSKDSETKYIQGDVVDKSLFTNNIADIISMFAVADCLDDLSPIFDNLIRWIKPRGLILILDIINSDPIDVLTRYRRSSEAGASWESGWNIFSKHTISHLLDRYDEIESFEFTPFQVSVDLPKRDDPMRTWTISTEYNQRQLINGAHQLINLEFLTIQMR